MNLHIGYSAPSTAGLTTDFGILDTEENKVENYHQKIWRKPDQIVLNIKLEPHYVESAQTIEFIDNGTSKGIVPAYRVESHIHDNQASLTGTVVSAIDFLYHGFGKALYASGDHKKLIGTHWEGAILQLDPHQIIFSKPFKLLPNDHTKVSLETRYEGKIMTPPGGYNNWARSPYGGFYHPKQEMDKFEQLYTIINEEENVTKLRAERSSTILKKYGRYPPGSVQGAGSNVVYESPANELEQKTVLDCICDGTLILNVKEGEIFHEYRSISFEPQSLPYLKIIFNYHSSH